MAIGRLFAWGFVVAAVPVVLAAMPVFAASSPVGRWRATEIDGAASAAGLETILEIGADGRLSGNGGCNRYGGPATIGAGTMTVGQQARTEMACPGPQMAQDDRFHAALRRVAAWQIQGDGLVLYDAHGAVVLRFAAQR